MDLAVAHRRDLGKAGTGDDLLGPQLLAAPGPDDDVGLAGDDVFALHDPVFARRLLRGQVFRTN